MTTGFMGFSFNLSTLYDRLVLTMSRHSPAFSEISTLKENHRLSWIAAPLHPSLQRALLACPVSASRPTAIPRPRQNWQWRSNRTGRSRCVWTSARTRFWRSSSATAQNKQRLQAEVQWIVHQNASVKSLISKLGAGLRAILLIYERILTPTQDFEIDVHGFLDARRHESASNDAFECSRIG